MENSLENMHSDVRVNDFFMYFVPRLPESV